MKITGFKTGKPRQFKYKPLYYDERKEELENLKKKYEAEEKGEGVSNEFKQKLKDTWHVKEKRMGNISRITIMIYLALAILFLYMIFF